jgi:hypothetical protein
MGLTRRGDMRLSIGVRDTRKVGLVMHLMHCVYRAWVSFLFGDVYCFYERKIVGPWVFEIGVFSLKHQNFRSSS